MANNDRKERISKIRTLLGYPFPQKPTLHTVLNQMAIVEQTLNLRLINKRQAWNLISTTITTVSGQSTYAISQPVQSNQNSGKVHFVVRATDNEELPYLEVPYDDFCELNYGKMPPSGEVNRNLSVPEKISFYRTGAQNQTINAVIQPVPQEVLTYTVWFFSGGVDRSAMLLTGTGPLTELADYEDLKTALLLLDECEWRDDDVYNEGRRRGRESRLALQIAELEPIVEEYIKSINAPKSFEIGYWDDDD